MEVELGPSAPAATGGQGHQLDAYGGYAVPAPCAGAFAAGDGNTHDGNAAGGLERTMRKRKAESQDNERLSKRLSLLNIGKPRRRVPAPPGLATTNSTAEQNGQKLYVPVESAHPEPTTSRALTQIPEGDAMELEDTKHKVYIYDLDAELEDGGEADDGRLVFLPDIEKHLAKNRIPPALLAKDNNGEGAGMQLVLYQEPSSLSVPQEFDSVRKAVAETRARLRLKQQDGASPPPASLNDPSPSQPRVPNGLNNLANDIPIQPTPMSRSTGPWGSAAPEADPDAMDVD